MSKDKKLIKKKVKDDEPKETVTADEEPMEISQKDESIKKDKPKRKPTQRQKDESKESELEDDKPDEKQKPQKKMSMEEKIAAKKLKKETKEEEPVFAGMKLKKSSVVKRTWEENSLEVIELKDHNFEKIPETEVVNNKDR